MMYKDGSEGYSRQLDIILKNQQVNTFSTTIYALCKGLSSVFFN